VSAREASRQLRIGCSGWNYPHWRAGVFYPPRLPQRGWLAYYAERFDTVELNTTFYRLPKAAVVARWVSETPPGFIFGVKVSRYITHIKRLTEVPEHLPLLYERIEPLLRSPKLGPLLWQLPPNYRYDLGMPSPEAATAAAEAGLAAGSFGGYKQSGHGRELGLHSLELYTEAKSAFIDVTRT
jgi:hypothetical protein